MYEKYLIGPRFPDGSFYRPGTERRVDIDRPFVGMKESRVEDFIRTIRTSTWTDGNPNLDNDAHIAAFYLQTSTQLLPPLGDPKLAYDRVVSRFTNFNEMYYVPTDEVLTVSKHITDKMIREPEWMPRILQSIYDTCDDLEKFGRSFGEQHDFSTMEDNELKRVYDTHTSLHLKVYDYARIPEALDRGFDYFTNYLRDYLKVKLEERQGASPPTARDLNRTFATLVAPVEPSELERAEMNLLQIATDIANDDQDSKQGDLFVSQGKKDVWLYLKPKYKKRLSEHRLQYGFLEYHGYGNRSLPSLANYIDTMTSMLESEPEAVLQKKKQRLVNNALAKEALFVELGIDDSMQNLFRIYPAIGIAKMYRRNKQLANFYFLDKVLEEVSERFDLTEANVRAAIPSEISALLDTSNASVHKQTLEMLRERFTRDFTYVIDGPDQFMIDDPEQSNLLIASIEQTREISDDETLKGLSVWSGSATGRAIVAIRPEDIDCARLPNGASVVIVSGSTDPDLMKKILFLRDTGALKIGAIITETGGVTSHAAITATELEIPTIVGVKDLLRTISSGDNLHVDAEVGTVEVLEKHTEQLIRETTFPSIHNLKGATSKDIGYKAYNLALLHQYKARGNYEVPEAFFIPRDLIDGELAQASRYHSRRDYQMSEEFKKQVLQNIEAMGWGDDAKLAIRSSTKNEDSDKTAAAGYYDSELNIAYENLIGSLQKYIFLNSRRTTDTSVPYDGGIIVQQMIDPDFSGVMFSIDPNPSRSNCQNNIIVEVLPGHNESLTAGKTVPSLLEIERDTFLSGGIGKIDHRGIDANRLSLEPLINSHVVKALGSTALFVEAIFSPIFQGKPADIEWAYKDGTLYLLQARALTSAEKIL